MSTVEKAKISDVPQIHRLINFFAARGDMLPRSLSEIYENIRDYFVVREGERVLACAALHVDWLDLAEVRSLAVSEESQRLDYGSQLVAACVEEACQIGIRMVYCLTFRPEFFEKLGFYQRDKADLPRKVWTECYRCAKFPDCDEIALVYEVEQ